MYKVETHKIKLIGNRRPSKQIYTVYTHIENWCVFVALKQYNINNIYSEAHAKK